jgi:hypothetical protein
LPNYLKKYKRKKSPVFSIILYISIVYFFLLLAFLLPVSEVLKALYFEENVKYNKGAVMECTEKVNIFKNNIKK